MLDKLSDVLKKTTDKIANAIFLDKKLVDSIVKDLQRALIEADINVSLVIELTNKIKKAALDERIKGLEKKEHVIKILHDELLLILGERKELKLSSKKQNIFMMLGLYGVGKTTTISKLALHYSKRGHKVCAIGLDIHRPAASEQLKQLGEKNNFQVFVDPTEKKDPSKIWKKFSKELKKYNLILVDTAGRDALDKSLISEIEKINKFAKPTETLLVMAADIGQTAKQQVQTFKSAVPISGVIITRMDSTAKAGGALTACYEARVPIVFIGTGEKPQDLEHFNPQSFLSRLLGMGDLQSLLEKIESVSNKKELERAQKHIQEGKLTIDDVISQVSSMNELGSMDKILDMIPGLGKAKDKIPAKQMEQQQAKLKKWEHIAKSMTPEERNNPELLEKQTSRIQRIAKGSGTSTTDVRTLIKQYRMLQELASSQGAMAEGKFDQKTMMKLAKKFGGKKKFRM